MWSLAGTALILGYMMIVGVIKMVESNQMIEAREAEEQNEEEGILLENAHEANGKGGYGALPSD